MFKFTGDITRHRSQTYHGQFNIFHTVCHSDTIASFFSELFIVKDAEAVAQVVAQTGAYLACAA